MMALARTTIVRLHKLRMEPTPSTGQGPAWAERPTLEQSCRVPDAPTPDFVLEPWRSATGVCRRNRTRIEHGALGPAPLTARKTSLLQAFLVIGEKGFEPATARPPAGCATRLRHSPWLRHRFYGYRRDRSVRVAHEHMFVPSGPHDTSL